MDEIRTRLEPLLSRINALSPRERLLVLMTCLVLFATLWHMLLMQPLGQRASESRAELTALEESISVANRSLEDQILQLAGGGEEQRSRIASLRKRIDEINATLGNHAAELIDPSEMARVLEGVLKEQSRLTLVRIRNTTPEFLSTDDDESGVTFYRHGLEIEVEGSYAAFLDYLNTIESLPWRLYWQVLELDVIDYPLNRVRIEVSTLSLDEEWIGA
ncbi:MAG: type II secretion system protein M [Gammaproteobacteria bacterium]|nr:type II secretion system protein M [Gammaproteobacteria bacterium]MDH3749599.1 type II secretion system protein M [Gammaproteobacteria bacterium]MDH3804053.1 type II secretion system protein M [Gammaproteobacteria bacterium]